MFDAEPLQFATPHGSVSALLMQPSDPFALYVLAHGAGAGMQHALMERTAQSLAERRMATLRYQFPYMEAGKRRPDRSAVLEATVRAAVEHAQEIRPELPRVAGGRSMGGRMTGRADAEFPLDVHGLVFLAYPLHAPGRQGRKRADHLQSVTKPLLFVNGTRDDLADLGLLRQVCTDLGDRTTLHVVEGANHSFKVLKRSGRTDEEVEEEIADRVASWVGRLCE